MAPENTGREAQDAPVKSAVELVIRHRFEGFELPEQARTAIAESVVRILRRHGVLERLLGGDGSEGGL